MECVNKLLFSNLPLNSFYTRHMTKRLTTEDASNAEWFILVSSQEKKNTDKRKIRTHIMVYPHLGNHIIAFISFAKIASSIINNCRFIINTSMIIINYSPDCKSQELSYLYKPSHQEKLLSIQSKTKQQVTDKFLKGNKLNFTNPIECKRLLLFFYSIQFTGIHIRENRFITLFKFCRHRFKKQIKLYTKRKLKQKMYLTDTTFKKFTAGEMIKEYFRTWLFIQL